MHGVIDRARTVNIRFLQLLTVRAHGQYNHRYIIAYPYTTMQHFHNCTITYF